MIPISDNERLTEQRGRQVAEENGYKYYRMMPSGRDGCVVRMAFTWAILSDITEWGYGDRWCYSSEAGAFMALNDWQQAGGEGEPNGWHRHPDTGRRRENGDPATEIIRF